MKEECGSGPEVLRQWIHDVHPIVLVDVDKTLRWDKDDIPSINKAAVEEFQKGPGLLIPITGAPLSHVPAVFQGVPVFAESGGVALIPGAGMVQLAPQEGIEAIEELRGLLGITALEGLDSMNGAGVLVEGPRHASLTLVSGSHPHYPGKSASTSIEKLAEHIVMLLEKHQLPLAARMGTSQTYSWIDITALFEKHDAVALLAGIADSQKLYYLGDGMNDLEAMKHPRIVPVGFKNSILEVQRVICERGGIFIPDKDGPDGGVAKALRIIMGSS